MSARPELTLLAPGLLGPVPAGVVSALGEAGSLGSLRRLLGRARQVPAPAGTPDALAGALLRVDEDPGAAGPLVRGFLGLTGAHDHWTCAGGCHLIADRDRLMVHAGPGQQPGPDEAAAIAASFNDLFGNDGLWLYAAGNVMALNSARPLPAGLAPLPALAGRYLDAHLPSDEASRAWRSVLNEIQMMLFDHPVNQARVSRGEAPINGLWFWGCAPRLEDLTVSADRIHADDPVLRGVAALGGIPCEAGVERLSRLRAQPGTTVVHWPDPERALNEGDAMAWLRALARFDDGWAAELISALRNGTWGAVSVHTAPGLSWRIERRDLRRFWRRDRPLSNHLATS